MELSIMDAILVSFLGLGVVFVVLVVIMVSILLIGRSMKKPAPQADAVSEQIPEQPSPAPVAEKAVAEEPVRVMSDGRVHLNTVSDRTAVMLMAIVANEMGKPLDELQFLSIKEVGPAEGV